jgi:hypothetical protein
MTERLEQRYCIKFFQKLDDTQVETIRKIQRVFGDDAMGITQIKEWYNRFKDGRTSFRWLSTSRDDELIDQVRTDHAGPSRHRPRTGGGCGWGSAHSILTDDLTMRRVAAKFVPKLLTMEQSNSATDSNFLDQTQRSCGSTGSLLS